MGPEVRMSRYLDAIHQYRRGRLSCVEAAEVLGISERHFRRLRDTYEAEGAEGLIDRRRGRKSGRRAGTDKIEFVVEQYRTRYFDFTVKHFHEALRDEFPSFNLSYTWTKTVLHTHGLVKPAPRRSAHRKKRPRRPLPGMMLHQDGSRHRWIPAIDAEWDLIVTMDDATSQIYSAFLVEEEGTMSSFHALREVVARHGLFCSLYTDRGAHYFHTPKAGEPVDKAVLSQVGRALEQLGIEHIAAYSPEARGRSERAFGTLQDRLPKELALAGITTLAEANRFIAETYLPDHNARFAVQPEQPGSAFVADTGGAWRDILCIQEDRQVGNDNTVRYHGLTLQLPPVPWRHHFAKTKVRVHHYPDGELAIFHGPRRLACFASDGTPITQSKQAA